MLIEEQGPRSVALLNGQCGEGVVFVVEAEHLGEIDGAEDIDVVDDERFVLSALLVLKEKPGSFLEAAAGVEQNIFAGDFNAHAEVAGWHCR